MGLACEVYEVMMWWSEFIQVKKAGTAKNLGKEQTVINKPFKDCFCEMN